MAHQRLMVPWRQSNTAAACAPSPVGRAAIEEKDLPAKKLLMSREEYAAAKKANFKGVK